MKAIKLLKLFFIVFCCVFGGIIALSLCGFLMHVIGVHVLAIGKGLINFFFKHTVVFLLIILGISLMWGRIIGEKVKKILERKAPLSSLKTETKEQTS